MQRGIDGIVFMAVFGDNAIQQFAVVGGDVAAEFVILPCDTDLQAVLFNNVHSPSSKNAPGYWFRTLFIAAATL